MNLCQAGRHGLDSQCLPQFRLPPILLRKLVTLKSFSVAVREYPRSRFSWYEILSMLLFLIRIVAICCCNSSALVVFGDGHWCPGGKPPSILNIETM